MRAPSRARAAFILALGTLVPFLCLSIDGVDAAPSHPLAHQHHRAELTLEEVSATEGVCTDATPLPIWHELEVRLSGGVAVWVYPAESGEPHALAARSLPIPPDRVRALLQVYRL